ncbi:MAG: preprotein translocase subunit SecE [Oscillospiraceae bacterium]|nr:preprotein translocase subunit SecE [Oscillospiraceae bacterium]
MADSKKKSIIAQAEAKAEKMAKESSKKSKSKGGKKSNRVVKYFRDLRGEIKKVVWPSRQKVINNTTVVVVVMCVCGIVIWGIDSGLAALLKLGLGG